MQYVSIHGVYYTHTHGYQRIQVDAAWRGVTGIKMEAMGTREEIGGHR